MNGRTIVMPSRSEILCRSIAYGAGWGAAIGALVAALPAAVFLPMALLVVPEIGAGVGAIAGTLCGLTGGLCLVLLRRQASVSRGVVRVIAGCGAGLLPTAWLVTGIVDSGQFWSPGLGVLAVTVVALAAASGPSAFYGRPRRRPRRAAGLSHVPRQS
jgi:hypothetical protein